MKLITIYKNALDSDRTYIARLYIFERPTHLFFESNDLEGVRGWAQGHGCDTRIPRHPKDQPHVLEVWI